MKYKIFIILIFLYQISNSQIKEHKYLGTIIVENNQPMSFSLDLIEKDGKVSGYSITNHNTCNDVTYDNECYASSICCAFTK
ncbi:MAG: hypothetical protein ACJ0PT_02905 [Flavobacteriales bacterium]